MMAWLMQKRKALRGTFTHFYVRGRKCASHPKPPSFRAALWRGPRRDQRGAQEKASVDQGEEKNARLYRAFFIAAAIHYPR
jgi:hypothetical protein